MMAAQTAAIAPAAVDWRTAPLAVGRWQYRPIAGGSEAAWSNLAGTTQLKLVCALAMRQVTIMRTGAAGAVTVNTTGATRTLAAPTLIANDPLLDQIAFSRGRFAIAAAGAPLLVVPNWAEPARLIEDCRR